MTWYSSSWTGIVLIAVVTAVLAGALGVSAPAALGLGTAVIAASLLPRFATSVRWSLLVFRIRTELRDPTGPVLAAIVGAAVFASGTGPALSLAAALAILALKTGTALLLEPRTPRPRLPAGSAAEEWLSRAERAVFGMRRVQAARESVLAERFSETRAGAEGTLVLVRRLATHEAAVAQLLAGVDDARLSDDQGRLESAHRAAQTSEMRSEIARSLSGIQNQRGARSRLHILDQTLIARMQAAAIGLEGLRAQLAEVAVIAQGGVDATAYARVAELMDQLEALRVGLTEADSISRVAIEELSPTNSLEVGR